MWVEHSMRWRWYGWRATCIHTPRISRSPQWHTQERGNNVITTFQSLRERSPLVVAEVVKWELAQEMIKDLSRCASSINTLWHIAATLVSVHYYTDIEVGGSMTVHDKVFGSNCFIHMCMYWHTPSSSGVWDRRGGLHRGWTLWWDREVLEVSHSQPCWQCECCSPLLSFSSCLSPPGSQPFPSQLTLLCNKWTQAFHFQIAPCTWIARNVSWICTNLQCSSIAVVHVCFIFYTKNTHFLAILRVQATQS